MKKSKSRGVTTGETKILRTRSRLSAALQRLLYEVPAAEITIAMVCREAGVSTDPLYKAHNRSFYQEITQKLEGAKKQQAAEHPRRRLKISITAEQRIRELMDERDSLSEKLRTAVEIQNILLQIVARHSETGKVVKFASRSK